MGRVHSITATKFAVYYPHQRLTLLQHKIHPAREEPEVKFCKVNSFVTGSFKLSHDAELIRHSFKVMI